MTNDNYPCLSVEHQLYKIDSLIHETIKKQLDLTLRQKIGGILTNSLSPLRESLIEDLEKL